MSYTAGYEPGKYIAGWTRMAQYLVVIASRDRAGIELCAMTMNHKSSDKFSSRLDWSALIELSSDDLRPAFASLKARSTSSRDGTYTDLRAVCFVLAMQICISTRILYPVDIQE